MSIKWSDNPTFFREYQGVVEGLRKAGLPKGEKGELILGCSTAAKLYCLTQVEDATL